MERWKSMSNCRNVIFTQTLRGYIQEMFLGEVSGVLWELPVFVYSKAFKFYKGSLIVFNGFVSCTLVPTRSWYSAAVSSWGHVSHYIPVRRPLFFGSFSCALQDRVYSRSEYFILPLVLLKELSQISLRWRRNKLSVMKSVLCCSWTKNIHHNKSGRDLHRNATSRRKMERRFLLTQT